MLLPFAEKAFVDDLKLVGYCLSENHVNGKHKAKVFRSALNLVAADYLVLKETITTAVLLNDALYGGRNEQGDMYSVDFVMTHRSKSANVRTAWIILFGESFPRLVSCYVK